MADTSDRTTLARDLSRLGLTKGQTVLVHASLSALGHVEGGAAAVIGALLDVLTETGTLLMPALSYSAVTAATPRFDVRVTPSNVGLIAETFRARPGVHRSVHPTHSVCALGPRAHELLDGHERDDTPCGPNSPFRRNALTGGSLLFLGCGPGPNTTIHAVEELVEPPYLWGGWLEIEVSGWSGPALRGRYHMHGFEGTRQCYDRALSLPGAGRVLRGGVGAGVAHLVAADALWEAALQALRRDPHCLVERGKAAR